MKVIIELPDEILAGCVDFSGYPPTLAKAVEDTTTAFVKAMISKGRIPPMVWDNVLRPYRELPPEDSATENDLFDEVKSFLPRGEPGSGKVASIAQTVEETIIKASTPNVAKEVQIVNGPIPKDAPIKINLYEQDRTPLGELRQKAPKDRFIEKAWNITLKVVSENKITDVESLFITAVEIAYTHLPSNEWGTEKAEETINKLVLMHEA